MLEEGRISPALASAALERHRSSGDRFEEALIGCGLPESMQLRYLSTLQDIAGEKNSTIIFPVPIDLINALMPKKT